MEIVGNSMCSYVVPVANVFYTLDLSRMLGFVIWQMMKFDELLCPMLTEMYMRGRLIFGGTGMEPRNR